MPEKQPQAENNDPKNEGNRISRSGTSSGISVANESTSGGSDPIPPGDKTVENSNPHARPKK